MTVPYKETHQEGHISFENLTPEMIEHIAEGHMKGDFGIQIAKDGRVWVCINGISFIRFSPHRDGKMHKEK